MKGIDQMKKEQIYALSAVLFTMLSAPAFANDSGVNSKRVGECSDYNPCSGSAPGQSEASCQKGNVNNFSAICGKCGGGSGSGSAWMITWECTDGETTPPSEPSLPSVPPQQVSPGLSSGNSI